MFTFWAKLLDMEPYAPAPRIGLVAGKMLFFRTYFDKGFSLFMILKEKGFLFPFLKNPGKYKIRFCTLLGFYRETEASSAACRARPFTLA
jgi:hypothetical protein